MNHTLKEKFKQALLKNADSPQKKIEISKRVPILLGLIICLVVFGIQFGATFFYPETVIGPLGKIHSPLAGSSTEKEVRIVGNTKNIGTGQHVWLAVDKPHIGLCWPKTEIYRNVLFSTIIHEEGPKETYRLSLYLLNETSHEQWKDWLERGLLGGLPILSENRRLDSVKLILKE